MRAVDWSSIAKFVGAATFVAAGYLTYGEGLLFQKIYIAFLVFVALLFIRDINVVSVILILGIANLSSEIFYPITTFDSQTFVKIAVYSSVSYTLYWLKSEEYRLTIAIVIALCIAAEVYWHIINYAAPLIYWYVLLININILVRYFLFSRVFIISRYFPLKYRSLDLDITLYNLAWYYILVHMAVILEYFARHIFDIPVDSIYYLAPYIFHGLTTYSALLILAQGYKIIRKEWFKA